MNSFVQRASMSVTAGEPSVELGLSYLKRARPQGVGVPVRVPPGSTFTRGEFVYQFESKGKTIDATIHVDVGRFFGEKKELVYHFSFVKFALVGGKTRGFNPQADSGPFMTSLGGLKAELDFWEGYIASGIKP